MLTTGSSSNLLWQPLKFHYYYCCYYYYFVMGISFFSFLFFFILPSPILLSLKHRPRPQRLSTCPHFVQVLELRSPTLITEYMFPSCKSQKWSLRDVSFVNLQNKILIYMCVLLYVMIASWHTLVFVTINKNWVIIIFCSNVSLNLSNVHSFYYCKEIKDLLWLPTNFQTSRIRHVCQ